METDPDNDDTDPDYVESLDDSGESNRNTNKYNQMPRMVMARGLSNRDGAKVVNAFYMDLVALGLIQFDERHLITESKIQREKDRIGKILIGNFSTTVKTDEILKSYQVFQRVLYRSIAKKSHKVRRGKKS